MSVIITPQNWIAELPDPVRTRVAERMKFIDLASGEVLKQAGDKPDGMFQVQSGYLRLLGLHPDGRQHLILLYGPGNPFCETTMVSRRAYHVHTTSALVATRVGRVDTEDFWDLYYSHPEIPEALCRKFASSISWAFQTRELQVTSKLRSRIVDMLVTIAKHAGQERASGITFELPISHTDIAEHLDVTRQAVQRECSFLSQAKLIQRSGDQWFISNTLAKGHSST
ncbi:Crp/Fnr family transcriptional regulator [Tsuneonella rigui]|uniref:Crp/Fnr family transcriptional regulator n=1 Tax=Tsuneonella rigui TaxID=1708790 RepID=UPI000F7F03F3|nr:Crp/Fnr family transcriptional regulator [Tsuneonella rigui]